MAYAGSYYPNGDGGQNKFDSVPGSHGCCCIYLYEMGTLTGAHMSLV